MPPSLTKERSNLIFQNNNQNLVLLNDFYGLALLKTEFLQPLSFQTDFGNGGMIPGTATEFSVDLKFSGRFQLQIFDETNIGWNFFSRVRHSEQQGNNYVKIEVLVQKTGMSREDL